MRDKPMRLLAAAPCRVTGNQPNSELSNTQCKVVAAFCREPMVSDGSFTPFALSRRVLDWLEVERDFRQAMYGDGDDGPQQTITWH
jgi:hypothetical protein